MPNLEASTISLRRSPSISPSTVSEPPRPPYTSAVSNSVMPQSSALWMTAREFSSSIRWPKLLQPSPTTDTRRPDLPRLRKFMIAPSPVRARRSHAHRPETIRPTCAAPLRAMRLSRPACRSASGFEAGPGAFRDNNKQVLRLKGKGMLHPIRATARLIDQKIGWNRIGLALSLIIIAAAAVVLYRILRGIEFTDLVVALKATDPADVLLAGLFVAAGYFTLTFYDLFALRTIGANHIPYRVAALAGFTSYSVGHNVGATVFTGGAVRYRVYSAWGLTAFDVAKICFIAGLTLWLRDATGLGR